MKLSLRLQAVADFIEDGSSVFDVGADHGSLEIFLSTCRKINKIFAVDNKEGPFEILKHNTEGLDNVSCRLSSGLDDYSSDYDTVVLAGMGGQLIIELLSQYPEKLKSIKNIIIDPHKNIDEVRGAMLNLGFIISEEKIVKENNHYYFVIHLIKGHCDAYTDEQLRYGVNVINKELQDEYIAADRKRLEGIKEKMNRGNQQ